MIRGPPARPLLGVAPMNGPRGLLSAAVLGLLAASPCLASPLAGWVLVAQTRHFSFYSRNHLPVDVERSERSLAEIERRLGQPLAGRIAYYRHGTPQEIAAVTGYYATGVTFAQRGEIHSTRPFHTHEIVHALAGELGGDPGAFFQEGLALALGDAPGRTGEARRDRVAWARVPPLSVLVDAFDRLDPNVAYPLARSFTLDLIRRHGLARLAAFFRLCVSPGLRDEAFARTFGRSIDEAGREWLGRSPSGVPGGPRLLAGLAPPAAGWMDAAAGSLEEP